MRDNEDFTGTVHSRFRGFLTLLKKEIELLLKSYIEYAKSVMC